MGAPSGPALCLQGAEGQQERADRARLPRLLGSVLWAEAKALSDLRVGGLPGRLTQAWGTCVWLSSALALGLPGGVPCLLWAASCVHSQQSGWIFLTRIIGKRTVPGHWASKVPPRPQSSIKQRALLQSRGGGQVCTQSPGRLGSTHF